MKTTKNKAVPQFGCGGGLAWCDKSHVTLPVFPKSGCPVDSWMEHGTSLLVYVCISKAMEEAQKAPAALHPQTSLEQCQDLTCASETGVCAYLL